MVKDACSILLFTWHLPEPSSMIRNEPNTKPQIAQDIKFCPQIQETPTGFWVAIPSYNSSCSGFNRGCSIKFGNFVPYQKQILVIAKVLIVRILMITKKKKKTNHNPKSLSLLLWLLTHIPDCYLKSTWVNFLLQYSRSAVTNTLPFFENNVSN